MKPQASISGALSTFLFSTALALASPAHAKSPSAVKTITAVMHSDLRVTDPIITTAYISRDHGYMVYDTLLAMDANFKIRRRWRTGRCPTTSSPTRSRCATA